MSVDALMKYLEKMKGKENKKKEVDGYLIIPLDKRKVKEDYIMVFQQRLVELAGMDLTQYELKVFLLLLGVTDFENYILITQQEIANKLGIYQQDVSKALKSLEKRGLILIERRGRQNVYKINPLIAWKGKEFNRQNILKMDK